MNSSVNIRNPMSLDLFFQLNASTMFSMFSLQLLIDIQLGFWGILIHIPCSVWCFSLFASLKTFCVIPCRPEQLHVSEGETFEMLEITITVNPTETNSSDINFIHVNVEFLRNTTTERETKPFSKRRLWFSNLTLKTAEVETLNVKNVESVLNIVVLFERIEFVGVSDTECDVDEWISTPTCSRFTTTTSELSHSSNGEIFHIIYRLNFIPKSIKMESL